MSSSNFPISIKLNSSDFQKGGFSHEESIEVAKILNNTSLDLLEISGGTYENFTALEIDSLNLKKAKTITPQDHIGTVEAAIKIVNSTINKSIFPANNPSACS